MGCDIHIVVERKTKNGWVGVHACPFMWDSTLDISVHENEILTRPKNYWAFWAVRRRNYALFARLAGVRGDGPEAKGMPNDASELARMEADYWGVDGHSHSYCSVMEFVASYIGASDDDTKLQHITSRMMDDGTTVEKLAQSLFAVESNDLDNYRVVFWFDN